MTRYLLDITRSISRIGKGLPTGVDRVEQAYISAISARDPQALALAKTGTEFMVLDLAGVAANLPRLQEGDAPGRLAFKDALRLKIPRPQRMARSFLRNHAETSGSTLAKALGKLRPSEYINVGHTNLDDENLSFLKELGIKVSVLVHDLIPLEFPEYTRPRVIDTFQARMRSAARYADRIICNSQATADSVAQVFAGWGPVPSRTVAHLGIDTTAQSHAPTEPPSFVVLGTIEPRKNHAVLLQAWELLAAEGDTKSILKIIGRRGWMNEDVFKWLDTHPLARTQVRELPDVDDASLSAHLASARALLFPSFVEGFGLPALEAAQMGLPVICSDLPIFHEILGDYGTYLNPKDDAAWAAAVKSVAEGHAPDRPKSHISCDIPTWDSHFRHVLDGH